MVRVQSRLRKCTIADRTIRGPSISHGHLAYHRARKVKQGFVGGCCKAFSDCTRAEAAHPSTMNGPPLCIPELLRVGNLLTRRKPLNLIGPPCSSESATHYNPNRVSTVVDNRLRGNNTTPTPTTGPATWPRQRIADVRGYAWITASLHRNRPAHEGFGLARHRCGAVSIRG